MLKKYLSLLVVITFSMLFLNGVVLAQIQESDLTLSIAPASPSANQNVKAYVKSYLIDLDKTYITWSLNDEIKARGIGKTEFSFTLGDLDTNTLISVEMGLADGKILNKSLIIAGTSVDLLWEAIDSYTPPFYKGKTLVGREGEIKVSAIPFVYGNTGKLSHHTLSYNWSQDGNIQTYASGFGQTSFIYKNSFLDEINSVSVEITDISKNINTKNTINIIPSKPKIVIYKKNNFGIKLEKSLENDSFIKKEGETLVVVPYFFSPKIIKSADLEINWSINDSPIYTTIKDELSIKPQEKRGQSKIKVEITNFKTLFQEAVKTVFVNY